MQEQIEALLQSSRCPDHHLFSIKLALEEALVNAIKHEQPFHRTKQGQITSTCSSRTVS